MANKRKIDRMIKILKIIFWMSFILLVITIVMLFIDTNKTTKFYRDGCSKVGLTQFEDQQKCYSIDGDTMTFYHIDNVSGKVVKIKI